MMGKKRDQDIISKLAYKNFGIILYLRHWKQRTFGNSPQKYQEPFHFLIINQCDQTRKSSQHRPG